MKEDEIYFSERKAILHKELDLAIDDMHNSKYQPPHWDHKPTQEENEMEDKWLKECEEASERSINRLIFIFNAISSKKIDKNCLKD